MISNQRFIVAVSNVIITWRNGGVSSDHALQAINKIVLDFSEGRDTDVADVLFGVDNGCQTDNAE